MGDPDGPPAARGVRWRVLIVPKNYAAGLEIRCPGGACLKLALQSPAAPT